MINKRKNQQIEINKKALNPKGTKEENRSAKVKISYNIFIFVFQVLVASGPHFWLTALVGLLRGQVIGGMMVIGREIALGLIELFL